MLGSGLLRDGTSTEKESRQHCSLDEDVGAAFLRKIAVETTWQATCTSHKIVLSKTTGWALRV